MFRVYIGAFICCISGLSICCVSSTWAAVNPYAKVAVHLKERMGGKNPCSNAPMFPCNPEEKNVQVSGNVGVGYDLYVFVMDADSTAGVAAVSFGIEYGANLSLFSWNGCADMEFGGGPPGVSWPQSGAGAIMTWDRILNCQKEGAQGDLDGGVTTIVGSFYAYAYGAEEFAITKRDYIPAPDFQVVDCSGIASDLLFPEAAGKISFGDTVGVDPCYSPGSGGGGGLCVGNKPGNCKV